MEKIDKELKKELSSNSHGRYPVMKAIDHQKKIILIQNELQTVKTELDNIQNQLKLTQNELSGVYTSREWKVLSKLNKIINFIIPKESYRRKIAVKSWRLAKSPMRAIRKVKVELIALKNYLKKFKSIKKRNINLKSKKIVYIGHSYHAKTKSTVFLIDYLKKFYDVKVILDESWLGKPYPELSFINESYLGVIFFQLLPSKEIVESIKNDNIIYFPMYDQSGRLDFEYWNQYKSLKIVNFAKALHEKLQNWGFESIYIQFFPEPKKFQPGRNDEAFFWQRLSFINIKTILPLFKKEKVKIHVHEAIDPDQKFIQPSQEDERKFQITYSNWFETKEEMWNLVKQKGVYVAPREFEGIGMSFLEAMAMGKAVVAVNNPTMNEYIKDGKNGYLFDLKNPKPIIDLKDIGKVQKNAFEFMQKGYVKWQEDKRKIIDFIKKR